MGDNKATLDRSIRNSGFSVLLCCVLGFVLLEASISHSRGKPFAHALIMSVGSVIAFLIYRALAPYYPTTITTATATTPAMSHSTTVSARVFGIANLACGIMLVAFGYVGVMALSSGWMTFYAFFTVCAATTPWSTIRLCRDYILAPTALIATGTVLGVLTVDQLPHPIFFLMAVWMTWVGGAFSWLLNIVYRQQKSKASQLVAQRNERKATDALSN